MEGIDQFAKLITQTIDEYLNNLDINGASRKVGIKLYVRKMRCIQFRI